MTVAIAGLPAMAWAHPGHGVAPGTSVLHAVMDHGWGAVFVAAAVAGAVALWRRARW